MKGVGFQAGFVGTLPSFGALKFPHPYSIDPMRCPTGMWQVGCVLDTQTDAQIWYKNEIAKEDRVPMTPELCFHFCKNVSGVQFMGLRNGDECYCTPFYHNTDKGGHGACDLPCTGDTSRMCGGQEMIDIYQLHDCNNLPAVPCKHPPRPVQHAKLFKSRYYRQKNKGIMQPCQNAVEGPLSTYNALCSIECEHGYEQFENELKCEERGNPLSYSWSQMVGHATCTPVVCGQPPAALYAKRPFTSFHYLQHAHYSCDTGYTLNCDAKGPVHQSIMCGPDAVFLPDSRGPWELVKPGLLQTNQSLQNIAQSCCPVNCGKCPLAADNKKYANSHPIEKAHRTYTDVCNYVCETGYTLDQHAQGKARYSISCMATGEFTEPPACLPVNCGNPSMFPFTDMIGPFKKDESVVFPQKVNYQCQKGYTFNQEASGDTKFTLECEAGGGFSTYRACLPVKCREPPMVDHAAYNPRGLVFLETVTYRCHTGYTLTGIVGETAVKTLSCGADGKYEQDKPVCKPVVCGRPPVIKKGDLLKVSTSAKITFADDALRYRCDAGYSTDRSDRVWAPYDSNQQEIICRADGTFEEPLPCLNINDCRLASCGAHGMCKDRKDATGVHIDDYTCICNSGYEITMHPSLVRSGFKMKRCTNINDCPRPLDQNCGKLNKHGQRRGSCIDLINKYYCACSVGYEISQLPSHPGNQTCVPKKCGTVPELPHASSMLDGKVADYDFDPWTVTCEPGYSLTGKYGGATIFEMRCQSAAVFSSPKPCKPVTCHAPPQIRNSDYSPPLSEAFFPQELSYTCEEGYSVDSKLTAPSNLGWTAKRTECTPSLKSATLWNVVLSQIMTTPCGTKTKSMFTHNRPRSLVRLVTRWTGRPTLR